MSQGKETDENIVDLKEFAAEKEYAELKRQFEKANYGNIGKGYHLTVDQYELMTKTARKACITANFKDKDDKHYCFYNVDYLAEFVTMLTGIYPGRELLRYAWYKSREFEGKGSKEDTDAFIEILIGTFTYDEYPPLQAVGKDKRQEFTDEQREFLKEYKDASDLKILTEKFSPPVDDLEYIGPSKH